MAKYDYDVAATFNETTTTRSVTLPSAPAENDIVLLVSSIRSGSVGTPPTGFDQLDYWDAAEIGDLGKYTFFAKLAGSGETGTYSLETDTSPGGLLAIGVRGPFVSLSAMTVDTRENVSAAFSIPIRSSASTLAQGGLVVALHTGSLTSYGDSEWSNSFSALANSGAINAHLRASARIYSSADSGVQTTATAPAQTWGSSWLVRVTESAPSGPSAAALAYYRRLTNLSR